MDYKPFLRRARKELKDSEAQAWLSAHHIDTEAAKTLELGYYDPRKHNDTTQSLTTLYIAEGLKSPRLPEGPVIVVPYIDYSSWFGIPTDSEGPIVWPEGHHNQIWNEGGLRSSEGAPVVISFSPLEALEIVTQGHAAIYLEPELLDALADNIKERRPSGPLVFIGSGDLGLHIDRLRNRGPPVPVLLYDPGRYDSTFKSLRETLETEGPEGLKGILEDMEQEALQDNKWEQVQYSQGSAAAYLTTFQAGMGERAEIKKIGTGFKSLDQLINGGLYPGLYVLGAVSSLGKTTFALQIADHIADTGNDVLFFTLEQSRDELIAKSLARIMKSLEGVIQRPPLKPVQILYQMKEWIGTDREQAFNSALEVYRKTIGPRMYFVEADTRLTTYKDGDGAEQIREEADRVGMDTIRKAIRRHVQTMGRAPVVFVDYLQILRPEDSVIRKDTRQTIDETVSELRRLSKEYKTPVVVISSISR